MKKRELKDPKLRMEVVRLQLCAGYLSSSGFWCLLVFLTCHVFLSVSHVREGGTGVADVMIDTLYTLSLNLILWYRARNALIGRSNYAFIGMKRLMNAEYVLPILKIITATNIWDVKSDLWSPL